MNKQRRKKSEEVAVTDEDCDEVDNAIGKDGCVVNVGAEGGRSSW